MPKWKKKKNSYENLFCEPVEKLKTKARLVGAVVMDGQPGWTDGRKNKYGSQYGTRGSTIPGPLLVFD